MNQVKEQKNDRTLGLTPQVLVQLLTFTSCLPCLWGVFVNCDVVY